MSNGVLLGEVPDAEGGTIDVHRDDDGAVWLHWRGSARVASLEPAARDQLRELLDRAAMPGRPVRRPCCDHCNNGEGDPAGHGYTLSGPHDGPCGECASEKARREHDEGTG